MNRRLASVLTMAGVGCASALVAVACSRKPAFEYPQARKGDVVDDYFGTKVPDYRGTEGELYELATDPHQMVNRWNDPKARATRDALVADLYEHLAPPHEPPLEVAAPT